MKIYKRKLIDMFPNWRRFDKEAYAVHTQIQLRFVIGRYVEPILKVGAEIILKYTSHETHIFMNLFQQHICSKTICL